MDDSEDFDLPRETVILRAGRFALGAVVVTQGTGDKLTAADITTAIRCHSGGDWGELCEHDRQANTDAVEHGGRILSAYHAESGERFWVITEADRSVTTVLFPDEY